jgi:hypothetical protein
MAHIFKHPKDDTKWIIIFTHKELFFFGYQTGDKNREIRYHDPRNYVKRWRYEKKLEQIKKKYYIWIHRGWRLTNVSTPRFVDFHMCGEWTITFKWDPFVIPLASRNFIPDFVIDQWREKYWDILCVAKNKRLKHNMDFLYAMKRIYEKWHAYKALLVCPSNHIESWKIFATELLEKYHELFTSEEKSLFTVMKLDPEVWFYGLSQQTLTYFYNVSKVFTLFSEIEWESRVIAEALLCNMPVVVYDKLEWWGRDYLNQTNSVQFPSYQESDKALVEAVSKYWEFTIDNKHISKHMHEWASIEKIHTYFSKLYQLHWNVYNKELININNLDKRLPWHYRDSEIRRSKAMDMYWITADVLTDKQFNLFIEQLQI